MTSERRSTPPPDLLKERDEVLRSFSRGAQLTEQVVSECARMHEQIIELEELGCIENEVSQLAAMIFVMNRNLTDTVKSN